MHYCFLNMIIKYKLAQKQPRPNFNQFFKPVSTSTNHEKHCVKDSTTNYKNNQFYDKTLSKNNKNKLQKYYGLNEFNKK